MKIMKEITILKTPYEWCLEFNCRPLSLHEWPELKDGSAEKFFFETNITLDIYTSQIARCGEVKQNSTPRKTDNYLNYRMYGLVPYNLSDKQKCIQYGHAVVEYSEIVYGDLMDNDLEDLKKYRKWANKDKTFIVLDGGTTNLNPTRLGSLNKTLALFKQEEIPVAEFYEPDLGDQLSAFVFLVDERVFDRELYPNFVPEPRPFGMSTEMYDSRFGDNNKTNYTRWLDKIGGQKNAFLRDILPTFRLA